MMRPVSGLGCVLTSLARHLAQSPTPGEPALREARLLSSGGEPHTLDSRGLLGTTAGGAGHMGVHLP